MATVDMRHVNFWHPSDFRPNTQRTASQERHRGSAAAATSHKQAALLYNKAGSRLQNCSKSNSNSKSAVVADRHGFAARSIDDRTKAQAYNHDSVSCSDDDSLPPLEEALQNAMLCGNVQDSLQHLNDSGFDPSGSSQTKLRLENSNSESHGTRDSPVILEDHEMSSTSIETAAIPASADVGIEPTVEPNKLSSSVNQEAWYDIEDGCYVLEDPLPPLEKNDLAPAVAQDNHPSLGLSRDASSPRSDGNTQCTSQEPGADGLPQPRRKDNEDDCGKGVSELEKDMLQVFKEQEDLSSANIPNPPHSHRPSSELACCQVDQEPDQSVPEVLRDASTLRTQSQKETDVIPIFLGQQPQEKAADEMRDVEDCSSGPEQAEPAEKRTYEGEEENIGSHTQSAECRTSTQIINSEADKADEEDEDDEEPRPAKRRKRNSQLTRQTQVHGEQHVSQTSRSPSAGRESVPVAEYQEWPFEGFLKRTRIRNETTYNLEFKLPCVSELLSLPIEACDEEDAPITPTTRSKAPYSKVSSPAWRPRTRVGWKPEDDTRLVEMKKSGCSWKEIYAAFPDRTSGTIHVRCSTKLKYRLTEK